MDHSMPSISIFSTFVNKIYILFTFQVLDARDPMGTRCKEVESKILEASKRILLVIPFSYLFKHGSNLFGISCQMLDSVV